MKLELISELHAENTKPAILFVHGAMHGAWCWAEFYMPYFHLQGWDVYAMSMRGHGASDGAENINTYRLSDYVDDVRRVINDLDRDVIIVGHSMGGVIAQMCFNDHPHVEGMVLLANSPLRPTIKATWEIFAASPWAAFCGFVLGQPQAIVEAMKPVLFEKDIDLSTVKKYTDQLCLESPKAVNDIFKRKPINKSSIDHRPVLVIGAKGDWSIPHDWHMALASCFDADMQMVDGGHDAMLVPEWQQSAAIIETWLSGKFTD